MNYYMDKLNFSRGQVKDYFSLALKKKNVSKFFRREITL
jgi:hypothetical protein